MATAQKKTAAGHSRKLKFKTNEFMVYPAHGVGKIVRSRSRKSPVPSSNSTLSISRRKKCA